MAIPFNIPDEQNDSDNVLTQRLFDIYQMLHEILLRRQPLTPLDETLQPLNEQTENEVVTTLETPFVEYDVQTQVKKKKVNRRRFKTEEAIVPDAPIVTDQQRTICPDWMGVGKNLRKIADNFHNSKPRNEPELPDYITSNNTDLLTTIVSLSPFRDSLWLAVFVVGYRILSNTAR